MEKGSSIVRICDFITKYSIYALVFLVPIFFLPQTTEVLDFNKQAVLMLLVFLSLFCWMVKILFSGKFEIKHSPMHIVAGVLFLVYLLVIIFSINRYGSFWGQVNQISEGMVTVSCLLLLYFLVSNVFSKKEISTSAIILFFSAIIAELIGVFQIFGLFIIPFDFAKATTFNTIGSVSSLGFFAAILFPLATALLINSKKWWRVLYISQIVLSFVLFFIIDYALIWWIVIVGSVLFLAFGIIKNELFDARWMSLPMFFLVVSLFFAIFNPQINWLVLPQRTGEVFLSQKTGLDIATSAIKENPVLGSGPGTFSHDFLKFKNVDFSKTSLWNVTFNKSSSKVLNTVVTEGILGLLAMLAVVIFPIFYGIKSFLAKKDAGEKELVDYSENKILALGLLVAIVEESVMYFLYNSNLVLDFVYFFAIAVLIAIIFEGKKRYTLKPSSTITLMTTLVLTLVFILSAGVLVMGGQRYLAEVKYYGGLVAYQAGQKADGLKKIESAANLNPESDAYFRELSQAYLVGLQDELQNSKTAPTDEEKTKIQAFVSNSINASVIATNLNPQDAENWSSRGYVYQNLLNVSGDALKWAVDSYDHALTLDPNNPYLFAQKGNVYLSSAIGTQGISADQKNQYSIKAREQLEKAVALNPNYSNALYSLGIVYDSLGLNDKAIETFTKLQQLNPTNTDIPKILSNLKAGKSILQTATPPAENPSAITTPVKAKK